MQTEAKADPCKSRRGGAAGAAAFDPLLLCLVRLTRHFNKPVSSAEIASLSRERNGRMTVQDLRLVATKLGYRTTVFSVSGTRLLEAPLPFVLVGRDGAAPRLIVERGNGDLFALDPASGERKRLPLAEAEAFAQELIAAKPATADRRAEDWRHLLRRRARGAIRELLLASLLINLFVLAPPLFLMAIFNKVITFGALDTLHVLALGMLAVYGFDGLLRGIRGYVSNHTAARLDALLGSEVVQRLLRLPYRHFESTSVGLLNERLRQLDVIRQFFAGQMPLVLIDLAFVALFLGVLFVISGTIAWIAAAAIPVFVLLSLACHRAQKRHVEQNFLSQAAKTSVLAETVNNALTIKSLGLETEIERRWGERLALAATTGFQANNLSSIIAAVGSGLQHLVVLGIIYIGAREVIAGELSLGALIAANLLAARTLGPARKVVSAWAQLQEVRAAFRRLDAIMEEAPEAVPGELAPLPELSGAIALEDLTLQVAPDRPPVLRDVTLEIAAGSTVVIVGASGAGKTTLVRALQGIYRAAGGRVLLDGIDVRHIPPAQLRSQVAVVPQEVQLFAGTIRENIAIGLHAVDPARVAAAAKFVGAHDFIERLPDGYETRLSDSGAGLSAGQKQLICIARALIRNPRILIMDEATSALDRDTERRLMANLKRAGKGRTIVMVSHRPAPAAIADRVLRVADGKVAPLDLQAKLVQLAPGDEPARVSLAAEARASHG